MSKTKRQAYGDGSLYQRKSDGLWVGSIEAGWKANGTRRRIYAYGKTEAIARRNLRDKRRAHERGEVGVSTRATVKSWAATWLPLQELRLAPNSYDSTATAVRKWIVPTIGHRRFGDLTPADVRAVHDAQRKAGLATSSQVRAHSTLMSLLKAAQAEGHTVPARVLAVKPPGGAKSKKRRGPQGDRDAVATAHAKAMLKAAGDEPSRWVAAFLQGVRQGEARGLLWEHVDLDARLMHVSWQLQGLRYKHGCAPEGEAPTCERKRAASCPARLFRIPDDYEVRQLHGALHLVRPKSDAGWRVIPLLEPMRASLLHLRDVAPESPHGLVWPRHDGQPCDYKRDDAAWYALQDAAGVRHASGRYYGIHEARHTTATLLLEAKVDPAIITAILGHSSIVTSRGYMHAGHDQMREALGKVGGILGIEA